VTVIIDEPEHLRHEREESDRYPAVGEKGRSTVRVLERTSWYPKPLRIDGAADALLPTILTRSDGVSLLYPGRLNAAVGESESCKTWFADLAVAEVIAGGGHALIVDFEDYEATTVDRLLAIGVTDLDCVHFLHPEEPLLHRDHSKITAAQVDLTEVLNTWPITLAVFDGVTEGMGLEGLTPLDNSDIARWYRHVPRQTTRAGAAAIVLDHVVKSKDDRGRYAIGGVHKLNGLDGAGYRLEALEPFAPGHTARIRLTVQKDRPGIVRAESVARKHAGTLTLTSRTDGTVTGRIDPADDQQGPFEPTGIMEKISRHLELYPGATKRDLRGLGNSKYVDNAVAALVEKGHESIDKGTGNALHHHIVAPYREHPDA
jgi:hypothetical protein